MKLTKIKVKNFRLLEDITIDINDNLSLIIGKNNSGKTSLLAVLRKFLNVDKFSFYDFSPALKSSLEQLVKQDSLEGSNFISVGISLKLFIEYNEADNLENASKFIRDLNPENNIIVLDFGYVLTQEGLEKLKTEFSTYQAEDKRKSLYDFLVKTYERYFEIYIRSLDFDKETGKEDETQFTDLEKEKISFKELISFKFVQADRTVSNKDSDKNLSLYASQLYDKITKADQKPSAIEKFETHLENLDEDLNVRYGEIFQEVIGDIERFGGIQLGDSKIAIRSALQGRNLLEDNTKLTYETASNEFLPESYNGLGYMNLVSIIFQIKIILQAFSEAKGQKPADINLLFIEEPEAHTHPQMQTIFIKNIKEFLRKGIKNTQGDVRQFQTILTTHSPHIVSESDFDDIKYFKKTENIVSVKNLSDLGEEYESDSQFYKFLKQYLTLQRADLFFAEKAIFIEGDTERILLPAMMKKLDIEMVSTAKTLPLLSQNISVIEVGAYAHKFLKFINFIGTKSLIITDLDSIREKEVKDKSGKRIRRKVACPVAEGIDTSNGTLKALYSLEFKKLKNLRPSQKIFGWNSKSEKWEVDAKNGYVFCAYQTEENKYHPRSFEDAFLKINFAFIREKKTSFPSLIQKRLENFLDKSSKIYRDAYKMAEHGVGNKPSFAMDILLNSDDTYSNWGIPAYIKEGLKWLKKA